MKKLKQEIAILVLAFAYMFFFTQSLPLAWEAHLFHEGYAKQTFFSTLQKTFSFSGNILEKPLPAYGLYFKPLFFVFGYDFNWFRIIKSMVFAITMLFLFKINQEIFNKTQHSIFATLLTATSFPIFIQTMVLDETFIIAEMYMLLTIFVFLKDSQKEKTDYLKQILMFITATIGYKTYPPTAAILGMLVLFTTIFKQKLLKRYAILFSLLIIMIFPFSSLQTGKASGPLGTHTENIHQTMLQDLFANFVSPLKAIDFSEYTFRALYWKPLPNIITFFGFWTAILSLVIITFHKQIKQYLQTIEDKKETPFKINFKNIWRLCVIWIICELPIFIYVPEPAIRYASAIIMPVAILFVSYIARAQHFLTGKAEIYAKYFVYFAIGFIVLTNVLNVFFFRTLLGSDIIAMDKVSQIVETDKNNCILYAQTYAEQYLIVDKTNNNYDLRTDIKRIKATTKKDFSEENFKETKKQCNKLFVVQQKAITREVMFPPIDFSKYQNMSLVEKIPGENGSLFDKFYFLIKNTFNTRNLYNEYYLWEYADKKSS